MQNIFVANAKIWDTWQANARSFMRVAFRNMRKNQLIAGLLLASIAIVAISCRKNKTLDVKKSKQSWKKNGWLIWTSGKVAFRHQRPHAHVARSRAKSHTNLKLQTVKAKVLHTYTQCMHMHIHIHLLIVVCRFKEAAAEDRGNPDRPARPVTWGITNTHTNT